MHLVGDNGEIELYEDKVIITRKRLFAKLSHGFFKGDKTIYLEQISGIQIKPASSFLVGFIQFTLVGGIERTKGLIDATKDENTVTFTKKDNDLAYAIKEKIEELKSLKDKRIFGISTADELRKYKQLQDEGVITEEEFEAIKRKILDIL